MSVPWGHDPAAEHITRRVRYRLASAPAALTSLSSGASWSATSLMAFASGMLQRSGAVAARAAGGRGLACSRAPSAQVVHHPPAKGATPVLAAITPVPAVVGIRKPRLRQRKVAAGRLEHWVSMISSRRVPAGIDPTAAFCALPSTHSDRTASPLFAAHAAVRREVRPAGAVCLPRRRPAPARRHRDIQAHRRPVPPDRWHAEATSAVC